MAAELSAALAAYDTAGSTKERAVAASQLAESVRACLDHGQVADAEDDPYGNAATWGYPTIAAGMTIYKEGYPVTIDGVTYSKAMNIFQAMKAPKAQRQKFANASWTDVVAMGREQVIDVTSWDANRETLMESILTAQAKENPGTPTRVFVRTQWATPFGHAVLPGVWKNVRANLKQEEDEGGEAEEDEEEEEEEEDDDDDDDDEVDEDEARARAKGKKSPAKRARCS
eukprot:2668052-Prymnesium_polylepis.1